MESPTTGSVEAADYDVVVAGAGPAGSALACWLARAGHRVAILDRCDFPRDKPCSEYLGPGAVALLDQLGVLAAVHRAGAHRLTGTTVIAAKGSRLTGNFALASADHPDAAGLSITRRTLDHCLLEHAREAGAEFFPRTTVEDLQQNDGAVRGVRIRSATSSRSALRCRLVVGADGLRSVVARRIGSVRSGLPRRMGFVTHVEGVTGLGDKAELHVGSAGYAGLNPLGSGLTNVALVVPECRALAARGKVDAFFYDTLNELSGVKGRVSRGRATHSVRSTGPFSVRARQVIADGALLVGDAADFFDPFTGEGIFSALRGAELAAPVIHRALTETRGTVSAAQLSDYPRRRRSAFLGKWAVERLIGYGMLAPALFDRAVARLGRRGSMAHTLIGVTADFVPARAVLNPVFLSRMVF